MLCRGLGACGIYSALHAETSRTETIRVRAQGLKRTLKREQAYEDIFVKPQQEEEEEEENFISQITIYNTIISYILIWRAARERRSTTSLATHNIFKCV